VVILKALLIALSLALDVFAVSIGVGMKDWSRTQRLRIGAAFVLAEVTMTLIGAVCGSVVLRLVGPIAGYLGFAALIAIGIYMVVEAMGEEEKHFDLSQGPGLFLGALAISFDSLGIGFSILFIDVPFALMIALIAAASIAATVLGFLIGKRIGIAAGSKAGIYAGVILALTGIGFAVLKATGHG
jgi:putative Mn2+ efflux pump MntP